MKLHRVTPFLAALALVAACDRGPTQPTQLTLAAQLDLVDPYVLTFNASNGLPGEPFHVSGPGSRPDARGPGRPFPDSLKLTAAQKTAIQALRDAFDVAHKADLDALKAIHDQARAAMRAGKSRDDVRAILERAKPILDRLHTAFDALHTAIENVLTPAQKAWIAAHKPDRPPAHGP
jgi:Spy/CpxP family protein refolding chaperone